MNKVKMYCVKCRTKREGKDSQAVTIKNGKQATKAHCEVCGTTMIKVSEDTTKINKMKKIEEIKLKPYQVNEYGDGTNNDRTIYPSSWERMLEDKLNEIIKTLNLLSEAKK